MARLAVILSFVETGRAQAEPRHDPAARRAPGRCRCASAMCCWWRAASRRCFPSAALDAPELVAAKAALDILLEGHRPYPGLRGRSSLEHRPPPTVRCRSPSTTASTRRCSSGPVTRCASACIPNGLVPRIANFAEWQAHVRRQAAAPDRPHRRRGPDRAAGQGGAQLWPRAGPGPCRPAASHRRPRRRWSSRSRVRLADQGPPASSPTTMVFGTPVEVTLSGAGAGVVLPGRRGDRRRW